METTVRQFKRVDEVIRQRIVRGVYTSGQRLPSYAELGQEFGVGQATVQKAISRLHSDGFVHARWRRGMFVASAPPHLSQIALVMPMGTNPLYDAIRTAAQVLTKSARAADVEAKPASPKIREYVAPGNVRDVNDWPRLTNDVSAHCVGGVIFAQPPLFLEDSTVVNEPGIPRAIISVTPLRGIPAFFPDLPQFVRMAVDHLIARGRKRIAHLRFDVYHVDPEDCDRQIAELGAEVRPIWLQWIPGGHMIRGVAGIVRLLMHLPKADRPDALVLHDDNLLEPVMTGLLNAGVKVPEEVEVVTLANFPCPRMTQFPVTAIGFDWIDVMRRCLHAIEQQRRGEIPAPLTLVPAVYASQFAEANGASLMSVPMEQSRGDMSQ